MRVEPSEQNNKFTAFFQKTKRLWKRLNTRGKTAVIIAVATIAFGIVLLCIPRAKHKAQLEVQNVIVKEIEAGNDTVILPSPAAVSFYDESSEDTLDVFGENIIEPDGETVSREESVAASEEPSGDVEIPVMGMLYINSINLSMPVVEGATKITLNAAAGHVSQTAAIGQEGNAVLAGHRSYVKGHFFNRLGELVEGDIVEFMYVNGQKYTFQVHEIKVLDPGDASVFDIRLGKTDLTLYTCTPVRKATHRLAIRCELIE